MQEEQMHVQWILYNSKIFYKLENILWMYVS